MPRDLKHAIALTKPLRGLGTLRAAELKPAIVLTKPLLVLGVGRSLQTPPASSRFIFFILQIYSFKRRPHLYLFIYFFFFSDLPFLICCRMVEEFKRRI